MGCGASSSKNYQENRTLGPDGKPIDEWWNAGEVLPGGKSPGGELVPIGGPFGDTKQQDPSRAQKVLFAAQSIDREGGGVEDGGLKIWQCGGPLYARAFFTYGLPSFPVGWARLELSQDRPHYNTRKMAEKEQKLKEAGKQIDYSRRKKFFLYPESIKEIGLFLMIDGKQVSTPVAVSGTSWACDPIEDAFFTFSPAAGSIFGERGDSPENSLLMCLRPDSDSAEHNDIRWLRLHAEFLRAVTKLNEGSHEVHTEVRYRYGNWKFVAWNDVECKPSHGVAPSYRYSDEERDEEAEISEAVAVGGFKFKLSKEEKKALLDELPRLEELAKAAEK
eukprot:TRINITY_DN10973_c0_g1_i1.p1 TRINITY_DN10973_c0_g1~~TRINITY_DN10973_c0_g1_i1.p1  ORF type:complete len:333 (+),score=77.21 TRINITY_DN10973_c0_g1_i1:154-1152(+)